MQNITTLPKIQAIKRVNRNKAPLRKIFSTFALYLQAPDVLKIAVTDMQRFVLIC